MFDMFYDFKINIHAQPDDKPIIGTDTWEIKLFHL